MIGLSYIGISSGLFLVDACLSDKVVGFEFSLNSIHYYYWTEFQAEFPVACSVQGGLI